MSQNNPTDPAAAGAAADNSVNESDTLVVHCNRRNPHKGSSFSIFLLNILMILICGKIFHALLRPFGQHRMISDFIIGVLMGNFRALRFTLEQQAIITIIRVGSVAFGAYLFVLGLEMEPRSIIRWSGPATKLAYSGIISTVGITLFCYTVINYSGLHFKMASNQIICGLAIGLASTSSPILTRLITDLKIGKSEIGRLAVRTGIANDMICTSLMCAGVVLYGSAYRNPGSTRTANVVNAIFHSLLVAFEVWFIPKAINPLIGILNGRNPEGKPIRGIDMLIVSLVSVLLCFGCVPLGFDANFNAFIVGLCLPREGRMSNFLISRINFVLSTFVLPLYLVLVGFSTDYRSWMSNKNSAVYKFLALGTIGMVGKLTGTVACSLRYGLQLPEAVALGLLLNVKGYFHIFCAFNATMMEIIDLDLMMVIVLVTIATVIPTPLVVAFIVRRARAREQGSPMGLQWCSTGSEVRIMVGLYGPEDVPMAVNVMEAMRGHGEGEGSGLVAYVVEMVEMTAKAAASLVHKEGMEAVTVMDEKVVELREQIGSALDAYKEESGAAVRMRRILAVSSFDDMHEDICSGAQDCKAALVVLPFHRRQRVDGAMDSGHPGYRIVNQKVLELAPCSVAILVDRGLGRSGSQISLSAGCQNVCVVFIGGADDREALAYASRVVHHPGVRLMIVRFLPDAAASGKVTGPGRRVLTAAGKQEVELRADDEYFTWFYERYVAGTKAAGYMEKHVGSGAETVATLRALEGNYQLFIVGRGMNRGSVLTAGMSDWAECPELGPIGDILAASDFSVTASVLIVQQHNAARSFNVIDEEFLPL